MITLDTVKYTDCTLGRLNYKGFQCFTLELPWHDNKLNISCIPEGKYDVVHYDSPRHGDVLLVLGVDGREMIEVHAGNYTRQILGCILVGDSIKYLDEDSIPDVTNSKATLEKLLRIVPHSEILEIKRR